MSRWPLWAVLAPGESTRLECHALAVMIPDWDEEDGEEPPFEVIRGSSRYHAIIGKDPSGVGAEMQIAEELSLECDEPVYSIERANDPWTVMSWRKGAVEIEEVDPETLANSLGCPLPGSDGSLDLPAPLRKVALVEGVQSQEVRRVLEEAVGAPLAPGRLHLEDTPRGLLLTSRTGSMGFAHITVSELLPHVTVYGVTASPGLDMFFVNVLQGGECIGQFALPPYAFPPFPVVNGVKGERTPERILAALGIPAEWFRNE